MTDQARTITTTTVMMMMSTVTKPRSVTPPASTASRPRLMITGAIWLLIILLHSRHSLSSSEPDPDDGDRKACVTSIQRMTTCLYYVTGHNPTPTPDCCDAVSDMREKNPLCLCKFIEVVKRDGPEVRNLGIEVSKLDDLPGACHMKNTSTSDCAELLGENNTTEAAGVVGDAASSSKKSGGSVSKVVVRNIEVVVVAVTVGFLILK